MNVSSFSTQQKKQSARGGKAINYSQLFFMINPFVFKTTFNLTTMALAVGKESADIQMNSKVARATVFVNWWDRTNLLAAVWNSFTLFTKLVCLGSVVLWMQRIMQVYKQLLHHRRRLTRRKILWKAILCMTLRRTFLRRFFLFVLLVFEWN